MTAALVLVTLILLVGVLAWRSRGRPERVRCCNPGQWPPDDLTSRGAAD